MARISIPKLNKHLEVEHGRYLMDALIEMGVPVASSCQGEGICGMCRVTILEGAENLTPPNDLESTLLSRTSNCDAERISCQCCVEGDIKLETSYW